MTGEMHNNLRETERLIIRTDISCYQGKQQMSFQLNHSLTLNVIKFTHCNLLIKLTIILILSTYHFSLKIFVAKKGNSDQVFSIGPATVW